MAPSQIQITTQSLQRLLKEEASYYKEQKSQEKRIKDLENSTEPDEDGNRSYLLKQERQALEETKAIFPTLRESITNTREKLESYLDNATDEAELEKAKEALKEAKEAQKDDPIAAETN